MFAVVEGEIESSWAAAVTRTTVTRRIDYGLHRRSQQHRVHDAHLVACVDIHSLLEPLDYSTR